MCRLILVLLIGASRVCAADVAALKKLMPADQVAFIEKIDAHKELQRQAKYEPNDLKRGEAIRKAKASEKELASEFTRKLAAGLKGWVGVCVPAGPRDMNWEVPDYFYVSLAYDGMPNAVKKVAMELKRDDIITVSITAGPKAKAVPTAGAAASATTLGSGVDGKAVKSLERTKTD